MKFKKSAALAVFLTGLLFILPLGPLDIEVRAEAFCCSGSSYLRLVNRSNPLEPDYSPPELAEYKGIKLHSSARDAFIEMLAEMEKEGVGGLLLQSAYRSFSYQRAIFEGRVKEFMKKGNSKNDAIQLASQSVQYPGASEHQTGLALDVSIDGKLTQAFADTEAGRWLDKNCHKFGFIIRYPEDKTEITGIIYEPWHLRYVGIPHASVMYRENLTLEEYLKYLSEIHMYVFWVDEKDYFLIIHSDERITTMRKVYPAV